MKNYKNAYELTLDTQEIILILAPNLGQAKAMARQIKTPSVMSVRRQFKDGSFGKEKPFDTIYDRIARL